MNNFALEMFAFYYIDHESNKIEKRILNGLNIQVIFCNYLNIYVPRYK